MKASTAAQRSIFCPTTSVLSRRVPAPPYVPELRLGPRAAAAPQKQKDGDLLVELRCPECFVVMQACHTAAEIAELDQRQTASRDQIVAAYEQSVAETMEHLADTLHEAFARDLLSPDDFAPPAVRRAPSGRPDALPRRGELTAMIEVAPGVWHSQRGCLQHVPMATC